MPSKKKKYNARFPPARIKKIMQSDEEVGKVAQVVPIIISKSLEIFVEQLLSASSEVTRSRNARTLTPTHIKNAILAKPEFAFLREVAQQIPDVSSAMEDGGDGEDSGGGNGTPTGNNIAPVDFSMRGGTSNATNNRTSTTTAATSSATIHQPGVLNLSSNSQVMPHYSQYPIQSSPTVQLPPQQPTAPRPRGRPRKRPLPEQLELQQQQQLQTQQPPFVPLVGGGGGLVQSPGPKKMMNSRVSFSPVALMHGGKIPPLGGGVGHPLAGMSPSSSTASMLFGSGVAPPPAHHNPTSTKVPPSPSASSSLEALTSVIASVSQPPPVIKHRPYLNTTTSTTSITPSSLISPSIPSATITRPSLVQQLPTKIPKAEHPTTTNSDYDSTTDYDTNGHGEEEDDDDDEDEDEDDDETDEADDNEEDEAEMAVANLSTTPSNPTTMTATQQRAQRTSVLVANPIVSSNNIKLNSIAPAGGDEDDDYDNI